MERKSLRSQPGNPKCKLEINGGINRPPLERTEQVAALFALARSIARELGFQLREIAVGGGSDGNFTAGLGFRRSMVWAPSAMARMPPRARHRRGVAAPRSPAGGLIQAIP